MPMPPLQQGPFRMPMFKDFVPRRLQPWLYVFQLLFYQLAGSVYLGGMGQFQGATGWMKEDVQMCMYCQLIGMAIYFPMVFRNKFRFTNKSMILTSAIVIIICNILTMYVRFMPLLWLICFIMGICKIMGTFESISNIQLWLTPTRNFSTFFPVLNTFLITCVTLCPAISQFWSYYLHWSAMHWFIMGWALVIITMQLTLCRPFCPMKDRISIRNVDFAGCALWAIFFGQICYILTYGNHYEWYDSDIIWVLTGTSLITLGFCLQRFFSVEKPYYEPALFTRYHNVVAILLMIIMVDVVMACRNGMESILYGSMLGYTGVQIQWINIISIAGVIAGGMFSLMWLRHWKFNPYKLMAAGMGLLAAYSAFFYFGISERMALSTIIAPVLARGAGYAVMSVVLMWSLNEMVPFEHFFQGLSLFNTVHMWLGGALGSAIYTEIFQHLMKDNGTRYDFFFQDTSARLMAISMKQIYGGVLFVCLVFMMLFLLWDIPFVRSRARKMTSWTTVGIRTLATMPKMRIRTSE